MAEERAAERAKRVAELKRREEAELEAERARARAEEAAQGNVGISYATPYYGRYRGGFWRASRYLYPGGAFEPSRAFSEWYLSRYVYRRAPITVRIGR